MHDKPEGRMTSRQTDKQTWLDKQAVSGHPREAKQCWGQN